ncbi:MAG: phosphoenolpyruvate carboxykinase (ATP) [Anaerolineae bacterium]|nr:phosphoenolpyruvate carboxykinase (ATP) [Anaerolineae bacterium]
MEHYGTRSTFGIENHGLLNFRNVYWNLPSPILVEHIIVRDEGKISEHGAVLVHTGQHTGRSPNDKFIVDNKGKNDAEIWWGKVNCPFQPEQYDRLFHKLSGYLQGRDIYIQDMQAGAHPNYRLPIRIITEKAWQSLFAQNLFRKLPKDCLQSHIPEYTLICCPDFLASPETDGTRTSTFIIANFEKKQVIIGGTSYAGEIKKSIFTVLNYVLPLKNILSMHCSANVGNRGDVALFFGLSGTGKTTLSSSPDRRLIGDDEHGWSDEGIFNIEGGCYAKTIRLSRELEPIIWQATHRFGSVLENVVFDPNSRQVFFDDDTLTENTRGAYPLSYVDNYVEAGYSGHPDNIFFLTADAFGVLPPIAKLTLEQAMYYFLSGYTSKLAGTEKGLGNEPQVTFSTCFGAPFLPLHPQIYARLLGEKITRHKSTVWLVNTGWTGGPFGVGNRFKLPYTRAMVKAALEGALNHVPYKQDPYFGLWLPESCPDVPSEILIPQNTWANKKDYESHAYNLIDRFKQNFKQFVGLALPEVMTAGPG